LDDGNFETARTEFGQASQRFDDAISLVEGLDTPEAADLEQRLRDAKQTADDARSSVGQQVDTNQTQDGGTTQQGGQQ
ncbi:MAG: hypothetical protein SVW77_02265, partial [Candidatus Nanohaloarchaea archaeon]|nr:hypothetical protein [Candidatus Nanohaloarchaea archaeon]